MIWATADKPNLPPYAAKDPSIVRWYQEDQALIVVRKRPIENRLFAAPRLQPGPVAVLA